MIRTAINPWDWSLKIGYHQAEVITDMRKQLICAGQTAVDDVGQPQHPDDMRAQMGLALDNLFTVLQGADMNFANLIRTTLYTTDMDATMQNFDIIGAHFGADGAAPPMSLIGVSRLAIPTLMFEIEATAAS